MTIVEYNDLVDSLYMGHDVVFLLDGQYYFLEREELCHMLYKTSENLDESKLYKKINGSDLIERVDAFLKMRLFSNKSFNEIYSLIDIIYIE